MKKSQKHLFFFVLTFFFFLFVLSITLLIYLKDSWHLPEVMAAQTIAAAPFPGTVEKEPNDTWEQAKANGYISLTSGISYTGAFDGNSTVEGSDKYYIMFNNLTTRRTFSLMSTDVTGVQLTLYFFPPNNGTPVAVASDQAAPFNFTYTFSQAGDYELIVHANPQVDNRRSYALNITNPDIATKCPWSAPIALSSLPGTGSMQTASSFVIGNNLFQNFQRNNQSWARVVPIVNGVVDFSQAGAWTGPVTANTYILPGSGTLQTESSYQLGNVVQQGIWRGDKGYTRQVPVIDGKALWSCGQN